MSEVQMIEQIRKLTGWGVATAQYAVDFMESYYPEWHTPDGNLDMDLFVDHSVAIISDWRVARANTVTYIKLVA